MWCVHKILKKMLIIPLHNKIYSIHNIPAAIFENQFIALRVQVQPPKEDIFDEFF